mgnify:CR=1 FL=1
MAADTGSPSPDRTEDQALIARIQAQEPGAFAELVHTYTRKVYSIGISMLRNEQDARDVVQETFLNVHRRLDTFRGDASLSSWIGRIATNNALMKLRTRRRKPETSLEISVPGAPASERVERVIIDKQPIADKLSLDKELGERIRASVEELPDKYREVLVLADYREMSMRDIATALDITIPNVKTRLHRARLRVRETLADYLAGRD